MNEEPQRRPLLGPLELFMLILGLGIVAYVTLQPGGGRVLERTETVNILDQPNGPREKARRYDAANEESVESILQNMAEQFSAESKPGRKDKPSAPKTTSKTTKKVLSKDEEKYYEDVRKKNSLTDQIESAKDWYRVLSASRQTYSKVKDIFGEAARLPEDKVNPDNLNQQLEKQGSSSSDFYQKLSESFQIDPEDIEAFGRTGQRALSDWADFVQKESKK